MRYVNTDILFDNFSGILSGISCEIPSGIVQWIFSDIISGVLSGILLGILSGSLSDMYSDILVGILPGILPDMCSGPAWVQSRPTASGAGRGRGGDEEEEQDAAHEPECSHVEHLREASCLNSLVHVAPVTVPVHWRLWNAEEGGMQRVECEESGVSSGECSV